MKTIIKSLGITILILASLTGCQPVKVLDIREIKPNETAWAIPLDGSASDGQVKFNSVSFLDAKKVASKRIMIDKVSRSIGRYYWDIEWIPAVRVIAVDRSLVTREWTDNSNTGTRTQIEGIRVNTKDNIALTVGLTITSSIDEDDASTYLYFHGEKTLAEVTDQNIRSYAVAELNRQVSSLTLVEFQQNQAGIYTALFADAAKTFKAKGITIQYLGNAEGWHFSNEQIQESINKSFIAQQDNKTAEMEQAAQKTRNQTTILNAETQAEAANKLFAAQQAASFNNQLQINMKLADAQLKMATQWDGKLPSNIMPSDSKFLMNLNGSK